MTWDFHDQKMKELKKIYQRISKQTQNRLQEIFNSFQIDFDKLYNIADKKTKQMIDSYIDEWEDEGLLKGQFGTQAKNIRNRTRVKNSEILELLVYSAYVEEQNKVSEHELSIMKEDANYYYQQGIEEVNRTLPPIKRFHSTFIPEVIFMNFLAIPNTLGYLWNEYVEGITKYNADQIYRQAVIDIQQGKKIQIEANIYHNLIQRQQDTRLCINGDKISGAMDLEMIGINNQAKLEGIKRVDSNAKVKFIAVLDGKETLMCNSLADKEFYIDKENEFDRYYGETEKELRLQRIKCKGLVLGLNLPPINHHFHWCRSTITYNNTNSYYYGNKYYPKTKFPYRDVLEKAKKYTKNHKGKVVINNYYDYEGERYIGKDIKQDHSEREKNIAKVIANDLGARVELVPRFVKEDNIRTNDIKINGEDWEIKTIEQNGKNTIDKAIHEGKGQSINFVLDVKNQDITHDELIDKIYKMYKSYDRHWVKKIIVVRDNNVIEYFIRN